MMVERSRKGLRQKSADSTSRSCRLFPPLLPSNLAFGKFQHFDALWDSLMLGLLSQHLPSSLHTSQVHTLSQAPCREVLMVLGAGRQPSGGV